MLSEACTAAMVAYGVLMNDGQPTGMELMNKGTIRVQIISPQENGAYSQAAEDEFSKLFPDEYTFPFKKNNAGKFPPNFEKMFSDGISFWTDAKIEFVDTKPDIRLYVAQTIANPFGQPSNSYATLPVNDYPSDAFRGNINLSITFSLYPDKELSYRDIVETVIHETGHLFGIMHPHDFALGEISKINNNGYVSDCTKDELVNLASKDHQSFMGYQTSSFETDFDIAARHFVRTGKMPSFPLPVLTP